MKKIILWALLLTLLLGCTGCAPTNSSAPTEGSVSDKTYTDVPGMTLRIDKVTAENGRVTLEVTWNNQTEHDVMYGEVYSIDRLDDDEWVSCAMEEYTAFTTVGYMLNSGREIKKGYCISDLFDVSAPGTYRFKTSCTVGTQECKLWAEFTLGQMDTPVEHIAQFIRTNGYADGTKYPAVKIIKSEQELKTYYETYKDTFDLERKDPVYSDMTIGFLDACEKYDEDFFQESYLVFAILEEGSGSIRHEVESILLATNGKLSISVKSVVPEVCTDDMAQWHLILELDRDVKINSPADVMVYLDDRLAWDGEYVAPPKPEPAYKKPPEMLVVTPEGETVIKASGYDWMYDNPDGTTTAVIADQASRPLPADVLDVITIGHMYAETVYAYVKPGQYEPTNTLGYLVKLHFDISPTSLSYTCWAYSDSCREESVEYFRDNPAFYAKDGGYVYEISATWEDSGVGYYGHANYYVYIVGGLVAE